MLGVAVALSLVAQMQGWEPSRAGSGSDDSQHDLFGSAVAGLDDIDGDGRPDLAIVECLLPRAGTEAVLRLVSSRTGRALVEASLGTRPSIERIGDVDADGLADMVVIGMDRTDDEHSLLVEVRSGRNAAVISARRIHPAKGSELLFADVSATTDFDGDGVKDPILCGATVDQAGRARGTAWILDGASLQLARTLQSPSHAAERWAACCVVSGPVASSAEIVVLVTQDNWSCVATSMRRFSTATGAAIEDWVSPIPERRIAEGLLAVRDQDCDGAPELLYGFRTAERNLIMQLVSGRTGAALRQSRTSVQFSNAEPRLREVGDLDGDGHHEVLVAGSLDPFADGDDCMALYSGATLERRYTLAHTPPHSLHSILGQVAADLGDVDGDGVRDVAVAGADWWGDNPGAVQIYSGKDGSIIRRITRASALSRD